MYKGGPKRVNHPFDMTHPDYENMGDLIDHLHSMHGVDRAETSRASAAKVIELHTELHNEAAMLDVSFHDGSYAG